MAVNLREPGDPLMPACNRFSMVMVDRHPSHFGSPAELLDGLHAETADMKRRRLAFTMLGLEGLVGTAPYGLRAMVREDQCMGTVNLSNVGVLFGRPRLPCRDGLVAVGGVTLESVELFPPARPLTGAGFGVVTYAGRLHLSLRYDAPTLTAAEAQGLLDTYADQIRQSAAP
jgi:hypothetical protein